MKKIYAISLLILSALIVLADVLDENGIAGKVGSPGENNCTGCHTSFAVNSGPGSITISSPNLTNWEYVTGQTYQIDVTVAQPGVPIFGFAMEALRSNNTNAGTLQVTNSAQTQPKSAFISGSSRMSMVHKQNAGLTANSHTFSFNWVAPATNIGNVKFYAAGNAGDNQSDSLNDYIYLAQQTVVPFTTGLHQISTDQVSIYPTPASEFINVKLPFDNVECGFRLYNVNGELVFNKDIEKISTITTLRLSENLQSGLYYLKVVASNDREFATKVLVSN